MAKGKDVSNDAKSAISESPLLKNIIDVLPVAPETDETNKAQAAVEALIQRIIEGGNSAR